MHPDDLPDRVHVEALREALWRPESRAAVLVGAGVSRNADKMSSAVPDFPLWFQIAARLQEALGPSTSGHDALRLGQMYENTYGRAKLDDLLIELIPDGKYEPGPLHERLLSLPWADVFTTNYDTLLERARRRVSERKYEVVETPADLTRAEKPRIVKLHGSFPARRPFVFTAEDYRRYPTDMAPFVNLVRQSVTENVICLVGFSGEDPNFLQWAGWVRDQLGVTAPKMYLCGALDLTTPARAYYQHMQVIPVDLGPLFPRRDWAPDERHRAALAWLLESLFAGRPVDLSTWPHIEEDAAAMTLPAPSPPPLARVGMPERVKAPQLPNGVLDEATLTQLLACWRSERKTYPGWAVCPERTRELLWRETGSWLSRFKQPDGVDLLDKIPLEARIDALYEIAWRTQVCLIPLPDALISSLEGLLQSINPRPRLIDLRDATVTPETTTGRLDWNHLAEMWVELVFALIRHAWQKQDAALHDRWMARMQRITEIRPLWRARFWHAKCWHHLVRLEAKEALEAAHDWPAEPSLPFWEAKRAAVLGELGEIDEARALAELALERTRNGRDRTRVDYQSLSEEGWILTLLDVLIGYAGKNPFTHGYRERERRLRELARNLCNPQDDLLERRHALGKLEPGVHHTQAHGFDPGIFQRRFKVRSPDSVEWALVQTFHDGTRPVYKEEEVTKALRRLWASTPRLALALTVRVDASDELEEGNPLSGLVGRWAVAWMPSDEVRSLYRWLTTALKAALEDREAHPDHRLDDSLGSLGRIKGAAEVLSRLAFRLNEAELACLFDLACSMYIAPACRNEITLHEPVEQIFRRVLNAATPEHLGAWMPLLLALPVIGEAGFDAAHEDLWRDPFTYVSLLKIRRFKSVDAVSWSSGIGRLIELVKGGSPDARIRASCRLAVLALADVLSVDQARSFVGAVWSQTDEGYPVNVGFRPWVLLKLPERQPGEARRAVARHIRNGDADTMDWVRDVMEATAFLVDPLDRREIIPRVDWAPEDAAALLRKLALLWQMEKAAFIEQDSTIGFGRRFDPDLVGKLSRALSLAIAPYLDRGDVQSHASVVALVDEMRSTSAGAAGAWPGLLFLGKADPAVAASNVQRAILGLREVDIRDGVFALCDWIDFAQSGKLAPPPAEVIDALVASAEIGRSLGLSIVLGGLVTLVERKVPVLEERHVAAIERALDRIRESTDRGAMRDDGSWKDDLKLDAEERMVLLAKASELAAALAAAHQRQGEAEPPALAAWRTLAAAHPLPEVRHPWQREVSAVGNPPSA